MAMYRLTAFAACLLATCAWAGEYDGPVVNSKPPKLIIKKLDPETKKITTYLLPEVDASVSPTALNKLREEERQKVLVVFLKTVENTHKGITEDAFPLTAAAKTKEYDEKSSSGQFCGRWRARRAAFGYRGFYGYGGRYAAAWGYGGGCGYGGGDTGADTAVGMVTVDVVPIVAIPPCPCAPNRSWKQ